MNKRAQNSKQTLSDDNRYLELSIDSREPTRQDRHDERPEIDKIVFNQENKKSSQSNKIEIRKKYLKI